MRWGETREWNVNFWFHFSDSETDFDFEHEKKWKKASVIRLRRDRLEDAL